MLLNDEEKEPLFILALDCGAGELIEATAKAQLKKVVEYIDSIVEFYECDGACDTSYHIVDKKKWQALLKEVDGS